MRVKHAFCVVITEQLERSAAFYRSHLAFVPVFESDWYIHLRTEDGAQMGFMRPGLESQPSFYQNTGSGEGIILSFEADDLHALRADLIANQVKVMLDIKTEPWGQTHMIVEDPNGHAIDIIQAEPEA